MKLEIEKEKVLEAAKKCPQAAEVLKTMFPEVFEDDALISLSIFAGKIFATEGRVVAAVRSSSRGDSKFDGKGLWLSEYYNWAIEYDNGVMVLVPRKKR